MTLETCSSGHDEICYIFSNLTRTCPLCEANQRIVDLEVEILSLETDLDLANERYDNLRADVTYYAPELNI